MNIDSAMTGTSTSPQSHTESSRMMRGAWKTDREYLLELHTERCFAREVVQEGPVGCDGHAAPVIMLEHHVQVCTLPKNKNGEESRN